MGLTKKKRFIRKKNDTKENNVEKMSYQNSYQTPTYISNIYFSTPFSKKQTNTLNNQQDTLTKRTFAPEMISKEIMSNSSTPRILMRIISTYP